MVLSVPASSFTWYVYAPGLVYVIRPNVNPVPLLATVSLPSRLPSGIGMSPASMGLSSESCADAAFSWNVNSPSCGMRPVAVSVLTMRFAPPMAYPTFFGLYRLVNVTVPSESPVDGVTVLDVTLSLPVCPTSSTT